MKKVICNNCEEEFYLVKCKRAYEETNIWICPKCKHGHYQNEWKEEK